MNDRELCQWLRANSSGTYQPSAEAANRIEALNTELAELKASIPKIKNDAIVKIQRASNAVVTTNCRCNSLNDHDEFAYKYAKNILTQAKDEAE